MQTDEPKTFLQAIREWRDFVKVDDPLENPKSTAVSRIAGNAIMYTGRAVYEKCADEAQPIYEALVAEVEKMPCECNPRVGYECHKHPLERILGRKD